MTARRRTPTSTLLAGLLFADLLLGLTIIMLGTQAPPPSPAEAAADTTRLRLDTVRSLPETTRPPAEKPETEKPRTEKPEAEKPRGEKLPEEKPTEEKLPAEESPPKERKEREKSEDSPGKESPARPRPCADLVGGVRAEPTTISFRVAPGAGDGVLAARVRQELRKYGDRLAGRHAGMVLTFGTGDGAGEGVRLATRVNTVIREAYPRVFGAAVTRNFHDLAAPNGSVSMEIYFVTHGCSPDPTNPRDR
ncbi:MULTISPECIES: hypothetical protein [unclassified Streptosporangium]|uniref:hypothetical protein n=1 Tax=unclassified Streptosporangium TaxID=2632669 RepID=UPI002E2DB533|nr:MULTISPECIES: hypothetical protein [unclassified Streptosporangium]